MSEERTRREPVETTAQSSDPSQDRRRALQAGVSIGPVLMTVLSRPVFGQRICTMSVMGSAGTSLGACVQGSLGNPPSTWQRTTLWPSPYVA